MERVKFLAIFASNMDEFFEIRVSGIKQQINSGSTDTGSDGMSATEVFSCIQRVAHELVAAQYALWNQDIIPKLAEQSIHIRAVTSLTGAEAKWAHRYFREE